MQFNTLLTLLSVIQSVTMAEKYFGQDKDLLDPTQRPNVKEPSAYNMTQQDQDIIINSHNVLRNLHQNTANLTWNDTLASYAAKFVAAYDCASGTIEHSDYEFGENIAIGHSVNGSVYGWYNEIKDYDFSKSEFSESTGHFTQIVWKNTKQVGCAVRYCNSYWGNITVCEYDPSGNWDGEFKENVSNLKSKKSTAGKNIKKINKAAVIKFETNTTTNASTNKNVTTTLTPITTSSSSQVPTSKVRVNETATVDFHSSASQSSSFTVYSTHQDAASNIKLTKFSFVLLFLASLL